MISQTHVGSAALLALVLAGCRAAPAEPKQPGVKHVVPTSATHVSTCDDASSCGNSVNPPTGGPHCPSTLACRRYETAQPRCMWIHNLEHGHVVLAYNCAEPCPEVVDALGAIYERHPNRRIILTPDPLLPERVAAMVWAWSYSGDDVNEEAIAEVLSHQDEEAPEPYIGCVP